MITVQKSYFAIMKILVYRTHFQLILIFLLSFFALLPISYGATLIWDRNNEGDLAGYNIYCGTATRNYESIIDVGNVTEYKLRDLNEGVTYYIALTAYDITGNESEFSAEIEYFVDDGIPYDEDNCPNTPNGPDLGTCAETIGDIVKGTGVICTIGSNECGDGAICDTAQGDFNENGIGDVCECYADLDGNGNVYPRDAMILLEEWKRKDCSVENPCQADIDGDGKVFPSDLMIMFIEYKRNDCPSIFP